MIAAHQLRAAQRRELLNVAFYRNAQRLRRLKDALSLLRAEADVFAEDVNAFNSPSCTASAKWSRRPA